MTAPTEPDAVWTIHAPAAADQLYAPGCGWRDHADAPHCTRAPVYRAELDPLPGYARGPVLFACQAHGQHARLAPGLASIRTLRDRS